MTDLIPLGTDALLTADTTLRQRWLGAFVRLFNASGEDLGAFRVANLESPDQALLQGAGGVADAATFTGEYRFDRIELLNGAGLRAMTPGGYNPRSGTGKRRAPSEL